MISWTKVGSGKGDKCLYSGHMVKVEHVDLPVDQIQGLRERKESRMSPRALA